MPYNSLINDSSNQNIIFVITLLLIFEALVRSCVNGGFLGGKINKHYVDMGCMALTLINVSLLSMCFHSDRLFIFSCLHRTNIIRNIFLYHF